MSKFVELSPAEYSRTAFDAFDPAATKCTIENARALMWLAQLAYETGKSQTIDEVSKLWGFSAVTSFGNHKVGLASFDTRGIVAERDNAVIIAFAGTDPAVWENLATDFKIRPALDTDTHLGFQTAVDAVQPDIMGAIQKSQATKKPLLIAGHSLGGALAALAARFVLSRGAVPRAVYVYGMPRAGGEKYRKEYDDTLGEITFRFVHGHDVVARVPMSEIGFRHVGRVLQCDSGAKFDLGRLSKVGLDEPEYSVGLAHTLVSGVEGFLSGHVLSPQGPGTLGPLFKFLPRAIRDHLQDCYYNALTP